MYRNGQQTQKGERMACNTIRLADSDPVDPNYEGSGYDDVERPAHYVRNGFEVIDIIEAFKLNYQLGNVIKYVLRHQEKGNPLKDLKKARWYINREIDNMEKQIDVSTF
jgi:hypothetical protein